MASNAGPGGAAALLAGYRTILRVHREKLPPPMRVLGDAYARTEFRAWAASKATAGQWAEFSDQWRRYVDMLLGVADSPAAASGDIPPDMMGKLSEAQRAQLDRLREAVLQDVVGKPRDG